MKLLPTVLLTLLSALSVSAAPVLPRQTSDTNYQGYTLENCNDMFAACKGHLVHPGHVPGGMPQCQFEMSELASPPDESNKWFRLIRVTEKCTDTVAKAVTVQPREASGATCTD